MSHKTQIIQGKLFLSSNFHLIYILNYVPIPIKTIFSKSIEKMAHKGRLAPP